MDLESPRNHSQQFLNPEMRTETTTTTTCDLGTLFSLSCRTRTEDFARKLHIKLKTLGSFDETDSTLQTSSSSRSLPAETIWKSMSLDSQLSCHPTHTKDQYQISNCSNLQNGGYMISSHSPPNSTTGTSECSNLNSALDSDSYYDFDIASPGSPVENGSCYTVINSCDDLFCTTNNYHPQDPSVSLHYNSPGGITTVSSDHGIESGCIFSSPVTLSPPTDGNFEISVQFPMYSIQHSGSADDCTSDTSDCSIYYDVETFPPSPLPPSSPKSESDLPIKIILPEIITTELPDPEKLNPTKDIEKLVPEMTKLPEKILETTQSVKQLLSTLSNGTEGESSGEEDESNRSIPRITRSSSLKTGKTPPGTPGTKKIVRFADALGLDLADVRTFLDEIPKIPKSAYKDLDCPLDQLRSPFSTPSITSFNKLPPQTTITKTLVSTFYQPISRPDFLDRVRDNKVLLENAYFADNFTIKGAVRVLNMDFHKSVYIRYSNDEWKTFTDFQTTYVNGSCDGFSDRFEFTLYLRSDLIEIGSRVIVAVRFHCKGEQFWDNNCGANYLFHCVPCTSPQSQFSTSSQSTTSIYPSIYGSSPDDPWINHMWL